MDITNIVDIKDKEVTNATTAIAGFFTVQSLKQKEATRAIAGFFTVQSLTQKAGVYISVRKRYLSPPPPI
jgi:hypothetical protein